MRGKELLFDSFGKLDRITPAYAGKSFVLNFGDFRHRDHPRLCGEKRRFLCTEHQPNRITPAYAGKRTVSPFSFTCFWDHPRLCGEKNIFC